MLSQLTNKSATVLLFRIYSISSCLSVRKMFFHQFQAVCVCGWKFCQDCVKSYIVIIIVNKKEIFRYEWLFQTGFHLRVLFAKLVVYCMDTDNYTTHAHSHLFNNILYMMLTIDFAEWLTSNKHQIAPRILCLMVDCLQFTVDYLAKQWQYQSQWQRHVWVLCWIFILVVVCTFFFISVQIYCFLFYMLIANIAFQYETDFEVYIRSTHTYKKWA